MANVGVTFDFAAESAKLRAEVDKVRKEMGKLNATAKSVEKGFKLVGGAIAGAVSIGAVTNFLRTANQAADRLNDLSGQLGTTASGLQSLQIAAQQAGGSAEGMNTALAKMSVTLGDALAGNKTAVAAFDRLGLSAKELAGLKADEAFLRIDAAVGQVGNSFERASIQQDIFGKGYRDIAGLSGEAAAEVARVNAELSRQGALLSDLDIAKIGAMNDDLALQGQIVQNLGIKFTAGLSPAIGVAVQSFGDLIGNIGGAAESGDAFGKAMIVAIKTVESAVYFLIEAFELLRFAGARAMSVIALKAQTIPGPLGNALGIIGAAVRAVGDNQGIAERAAESLDAIAASALENARLAGAAALKAGSDLINVSETFDRVRREAEARADAAAARNAAAQAAARQVPYDANAARRAAGGATDKQLGSTAVSGDSLGRTDPQLDPEVLHRTSINDTLQAMQDTHNATMIGKIETFNTTTLGMMLSNAEMMQQIEFAKNATLGDAMGSLVQMAIAQGGTLAKVGKALYVASTVWATSNAIMEVMGYRGPGWPQNVAVAASIAAMGAAQIANIRRTNPGSGGSIASVRGGGSAATPALSDNVGPQGQPLEQQSVAQVNIYGNVFGSQETADWIIEQIRNAVDSRDVVLISGTSRQALELANA